MESGRRSANVEKLTSRATNLREKYGKRRKIEYVSEMHKECALIIHTTIELLCQRQGARCIGFIVIPPPKNAN